MNFNSPEENPCWVSAVKIDAAKIDAAKIILRKTDKDIIDNLNNCLFQP